MSEKKKVLKENSNKTETKTDISEKPQKDVTAAARVALENRKKIQTEKNTKQRELDEKKISLIAFVVILLAFILLSLFVCKIAIVPVCVIALIEAALAKCLNNLPLWIHIIVMALEIIAGILCGKILFMILASIVYLGGIVTLCYLDRN